VKFPWIHTPGEIPLNQDTIRNPPQTIYSCFFLLRFPAFFIEAETCGVLQYYVLKNGFATSNSHSWCSRGKPFLQRSSTFVWQMEYVVLYDSSICSQLIKSGIYRYGSLTACWRALGGNNNIDALNASAIGWGGVRGFELFCVGKESCDGAVCKK